MVLLNHLDKSLVKILGLSDYEIKAYLKLVEKGPLRPKTLSFEANIPYTKIYSVVIRLEKKGLVKVDRSRRPHTVVAVPPVEAYIKLKSMVEEKLEDLEKKVKLLQELYESSHRGFAQREFITIIRGLKPINERAVNILVGASSSVRVAIPFQKFLSEDLKKNLIEESVKKLIKILATKKLEPLFRDLPARIEVKYLDKMFGGGVISEKEVLLVVEHRGEILAAYSSFEYIVEIAKTYFDYLWTAG
ncbi:MAG: TrmB family transcriptional regulator [Thermoprotei archaeon]|nr:MAG: TrmB family transcriptional regulator [Thermoprotei archaeon]